MKYRGEIDGLSAIAVLSIIFFHAGFKYFKGGFVGVDIFFVISGYLIASMILHEKEQGIFSLPNFYERRVRRILPALFSVLFASTLLSLLHLSPGDMKDFSLNLIGVATFSSNILFWAKEGYWGTEAQFNPLMHLWSLSLEEQFYVLLPLFLIFMWRFKATWTIHSLILIFIVSLSLSHWAAFNMRSANFFLLPTRAWEFSIGVLAAFSLFSPKPFLEKLRNNKILTEIVSWIGLFLILFTIFSFSRRTPFPSLYALIPTIGTVLIILFCNQQTLLGKLLSSRIPVFIGLISYSAYLWHQPLFAFTRTVSLGTPKPVVFVFLSLISFCIAYLSWRYIEMPFRKKAFLSRKAIFQSAILGSLIFIFFGLAGILSTGFPDRYSEEQRQIASLTLESINAERNRLTNELCNTKFDHVICGKIDPNQFNVLVVGDSHGPDGLNILAQALPSANFLIAEKSACPFFKQDTKAYVNELCRNFNKGRFDAIEMIKNDLDLIVLSHRLSASRTQATKESINWIHNKKIPFVVMGAGYYYSRDLSTLILQFNGYSPSGNSQPSNSQSNNNKELNEKLASVAVTTQFKADDELQPYTEQLQGYYLKKTDSLCPASLCQNILPNGDPVLFDQHHLTLSAAQFLGDSFKEKLSVWLIEYATNK